MERLRPIMLIGTEDRKALIQDIQQQLQVLLEPQDIESQILDYTYFKDGSPDILLPESVRGKHVYIVSDVYSDAPNDTWFVPSVNDRYHESRLLQRTAKVYGAKTVNVIFPAFPYARDDKFDNMGTKASMKRKPNAASMVIQDCYANNLNYVLTQDIHNLATISVPFTGGSMTHFVSLSYGWTIEEVIKRAWLDKDNITLSGTDEWAVRKIDAVCKDLKLPKLVSLKEKDYSKPQGAEKIQVFGDATDRDVVLYDDILDTGWTMIKCLVEIKNKSPRSVNLLISHALFNGDSLEKLLEAHKEWLFDKLYITNSVLKQKVDTFFAEKKYTSFVEIIDLSTIFAHTIESIAKEKDINYNNNEAVLTDK